MDLNNIVVTEDRISELPDSIIYHILSFLEIKDVACTSVLSKRWDHIWTSIPTLVFPDYYKHSEISKFMDFVDRKLHLHDTSSNIQKVHIHMNDHFNASRVHSWISGVTKRNIKELSLYFDQREPFPIPLSLFTCESLITLEISATFNIRLPITFSFPNLKSLTLYCVHFSDDQHLSCPLLEDLRLVYCNWFGARNFSISTPALKLLEISNDDMTVEDDGLQDCALKINAPNLVSLAYDGSLAREYVLSIFQTLESAEVLFYEYAVRREQNIGAAVSKFFHAVAHIQSLTIYADTLEVFSMVDNFVNILPTFHNLEKLFLNQGETTDNYKSLFPLLKVAPNLTRLVFNDRIRDRNEEEEEEEEGSWGGHMLTGGSLFQHLQSVCFVYFSGNAREMRWLKLILKNAKALQKVIIGKYGKYSNAKNKQVLMSEFLSLPKASSRCVIEFH